MSRFKETYTACVVSTAHLPREIAEYMDAGHAETNIPGGLRDLVFDKIEYGYRIWVDMANEWIPEELKHIVLAARREGFKFIEFDCDADKVAGFKTWEW
jgi:hypothetical protein